MNVCSKWTRWDSRWWSRTSTPTGSSPCSRRRSTLPAPTERAKLRLAAQWCVLHPATADTGVATWAGDALPGVLHQDESLGGEGTPAVSAFAPEPVAAALGVSTLTGMKLIADALDLQHRLPRIWRLVEDLAVEPWKARQVAQATHVLSKAAAAYVDDQLAPKLASCGFAAIQTDGRDGDRQVPPRAPRGEAEAGPEGLARHPAAPRPRRLRRHQLPRRGRRHPRPDRLPRPGLRPGRPAEGARRHRRPRDPQGQGPRRDRRPAGHPRPARPHRRATRWATGPRWSSRSRPPRCAAGRPCSTRTPP